MKHSWLACGPTSCVQPCPPTTSHPIDCPTTRPEHDERELAIRDLKAGAGLEHLPSGVFSANSAWFQIAILAHNMFRWTVRLGGHDTDRLIVARTIRTRLLALPGRLVNRAGKPTLRLPTRWPWAEAFTTILEALRALEPVPT